jgi:hypothetical protein
MLDTMIIGNGELTKGFFVKKNNINNKYLTRHWINWEKNIHETVNDWQW